MRKLAVTILLAGALGMVGCIDLSGSQKTTVAAKPASPPARKAPPPSAPKPASPDLVQGKLLNPFKR